MDSDKPLSYLLTYLLCCLRHCSIGPVIELPANEVLLREGAVVEELPGADTHLRYGRLCVPVR